MQVNPDSGGRVMTNLEILQHPLSKWGHKKNSFRCDHTTNGARPAGGLVQCCLTGCFPAPFRANFRMPDESETILLYSDK
jgi:hypothetical protein